MDLHYADWVSDRMKKVYIMSAKYAPGHFSHMLAYYELFREIDCVPVLYLDKQYDSFVKEYPQYEFQYISGESEAPDILFIYNLSPDDTSITKRFQKINPAMKVYFVYHEPWYGFREWFRNFRTGTESARETVKAVGRYFFVKRLVKRCTKVILPSNAALYNYEKYCRFKNVDYDVFPLIFTDECGESLTVNDKQYFSFIATASKSRNFRLFIEYLKYKAKTDKTAKFQIATRTDVSEYLDDELQELIDQRRLIVNHGHSLTNQEINLAYSISNCTWMLYNRSTQSGVICKSFMFGAPVIASEIGSFKEIVTPENGVILYGSYSLDDIDNAYESIRNNLCALSDGARNAFMSNFYFSNHVDRFKEIING